MVKSELRPFSLETSIGNHTKTESGIKIEPEMEYF